MTPEQYLRDGVDTLSTYLNALGFKFEFKSSGKGSGGHFAYGQFIKSGGLFRKRRIIEIHFRYSLGLVSYQVDDLRLSHEEYIDLLGKHGQNKYPNVSDDPTDAFKCLLLDIENLLDDFTKNKATIFRQRVNGIIKVREDKFNILSNKIYSGDQRVIDQAKVEFKKGDYNQVDKLRKQIQHPELLTAVEQKMFELNDKRKDNG